MRGKTQVSEEIRIVEESAFCNSGSNTAARCKTLEPAQVLRPPVADFHGPPESESNPLHFDSVTLWRLWCETDRYVTSLAQAVSEGKCVNEASNFARWLQFSGILPILEANPSGGALRVDGVGLRKKVKDLVFECGERFRTGKADARYSASDIAEINRKLDIIAAHIARDQPVQPAAEALRVIEGGTCA